MAKEMLMQASLKLYIGAHDVIKVKGMQKEVAHVHMQLLKDRHKIGSHHVCNVIAALHASKCQHLNTYNYIYSIIICITLGLHRKCIAHASCRTSGQAVEVSQFLAEASGQPIHRNNTTLTRLVWL